MATAICTLEPGLFQLLANGVHPLHHTCLDIYTCLASAWRLHARGHKQSPGQAAVAHARAALYTLLLAHGLRQLLNTGTLLLLKGHQDSIERCGVCVMSVEVFACPREAAPLLRLGLLLRWVLFLV